MRGLFLIPGWLGYRGLMSRHISPVLPLEMLIARRQVPGVFYVGKYGRVGSFDATTIPVDVVNLATPGQFTGFAAAAETVDIVSTLDADTAVTGAGMRTAEVYGLDTNGSIASATYDLGGTAGVTTAEEWKHIYRVKGRTAGTSLNNDGVITFTQSVSGAVLANIAAGVGQTEQAAIEMPSDMYGVVAARTFSIRRATGSGSKSAVIGYWVKSNGDTCWRVVNPVSIAADSPPHVAGQYAQLLSLDPGDQVVVRVFDADSAALEATAEFDLFMFPWQGGPDEAG